MRTMSRILIFAQFVLGIPLVAHSIDGLYDLHQMYLEVETIELVPGVYVRADIWPYDYVPSVEDFVAVGVPYEDAVRICHANPPRGEVHECTWGQIKMCFMGIPNPCCPDRKTDG